ncbi:MAG TPA: hypothetical protein VF395_03155 [Polyangiaceae bacterium]
MIESTVDRSTPPQPETLRGQVRRVARASRWVALLLVAPVSFRFAVAGVEHALRVSNANFAQKPASHGPASAETAAPVAPGWARPERAAAPAPSASGGRPFRVTLGVNYGEPRSEVYVNGSLVGQTPFLGDTSCKSGQPIRIEVVPKSGLPLTYLRRCQGGSLELNGPPP